MAVECQRPVLCPPSVVTFSMGEENLLRRKPAFKVQEQSPFPVGLKRNSAG